MIKTRIAKQSKKMKKKKIEKKKLKMIRKNILLYIER